MSQFYRFFLATASLALAWPSSVPAQTLDAELRGISPAKLVLEARETGDAARGAIVFFQPYLACSCLLYTSPSPRDVEESRMPSSA